MALCIKRQSFSVLFVLTFLSNVFSAELLFEYSVENILEDSIGNYWLPSDNLILFQIQKKSKKPESSIIALDSTGKKRYSVQIKKGVLFDVFYFRTLDIVILQFSERNKEKEIVAYFHKIVNKNGNVIYSSNNYKTRKSFVEDAFNNQIYDFPYFHPLKEYNEGMKLNETAYVMSLRNNERKKWHSFDTFIMDMVVLRRTVIVSLVDFRIQAVNNNGLKKEIKYKEDATVNVNEAYSTYSGTIEKKSDSSFVFINHSLKNCVIYDHNLHKISASKFKIMDGFKWPKGPYKMIQFGYFDENILFIDKKNKVTAFNVTSREADVREMLRVEYGIKFKVPNRVAKFLYSPSRTKISILNSSGKFGYFKIW